MTIGAPGVAASLDQVGSPAAAALPSRQHRRGGPASRHAPTRTSADPVHDDPVVIDLVARAGNGDKQAWDALVERYSPLIWSTCRRHRLGEAEAQDVSQSVWLRLVDQLDKIRDPAALPGWLATTTRRECGRIRRMARGSHATGYPPDTQNMPDEQGVTAEQELLAAEAHAALREAVSQLPPRCQQLIAALTEDPPLPYAKISARLGIPVGSIGPGRRRCLDKIRRHPAIAALINAGTGTASGELPVRKACPIQLQGEPDVRFPCHLPPLNRARRAHQCTRRFRCLSFVDFTCSPTRVRPAVLTESARPTGK